MLHSRQHLIQWVMKNAKDRVIQNALENGTIINFGGFDPLSGSNPGFVISITSIREKVYYIGVVLDQINFQIRWFRMKEVPWWNWVGDKSNSLLYQGDKPKVCEVLKENVHP